MLRCVVILCCLAAIPGCGANTSATTQSSDQFKRSLQDIEKQQQHNKPASSR